MTPRRHVGLALAAGLIVAVVLAVATTRTVSSAWAACGDLEPPYVGGLLYVLLPALVVLEFAVWVIATFVSRRRPARVGVIAAVAAAAAVSWLVVAFLVPMNEPAYYAAQTTSSGELAIPGGAGCRSDGTPTWWPGWLPV